MPCGWSARCIRSSRSVPDRGCGTVTKDQMVAWTAAGEGKAEDRGRRPAHRRPRGGRLRRTLPPPSSTQTCIASTSISSGRATAGRSSTRYGMTELRTGPRADASPLPGRGGVRRARRRSCLLRGVRARAADGPPAADVVDHPLAPVEGADPVPRAPLPCGHVRRTRQRPLRPAVGAGGVRRARVRGRRVGRPGRDRDRARCDRGLLARARNAG